MHAVYTYTYIRSSYKFSHQSNAIAIYEQLHYLLGNGIRFKPLHPVIVRFLRKKARGCSKTGPVNYYRKIVLLIFTVKCIYLRYI